MTTYGIKKQVTTFIYEYDIGLEEASFSLVKCNEIYSQYYVSHRLL